MKRSLRNRAAVFSLSLAALAMLNLAVAHAGQVRINVGTPSNQFTPRVVNMNLGDHAVWVWVSGAHTVSSGDSSTGTPDRIFDSTNGSDFALSGLRYSWKSSQTGNIPYFCIPHAPDMAGRVVVSPLTQPPTIAVADFRLTEVQFNVPLGKDLIEIANLGAAAGDLRSFRLAAGGAAVDVVGANFPVPALGRVVIHTNETGANDTPPGHIYLPALGPLNDAAGSLSLYVPSTVAPQNALTTSSMMLDFVQWGAGAQANETTAGAAGFWTSGQAINGVAAGHSIEYCANATLDHGVTRWAEIDPPNFGGNSNCTTPVLTQTWGRLKTIYRP